MLFTFNLPEKRRKYPTTFSQFCDEIDVGRNRMYKKLVDLGILDVQHYPVEEYSKYFEAYETMYTAKAGKPSFYVTDEGKDFIKSLLTEEDFKALKKSKYARSRSKLKYRGYRDLTDI